MRKTNTTKTNVAAETCNIKRCIVKGYKGIVDTSMHAFELVDGLVGKTPSMASKARAEAKAEMVSIFAELGI